MTTKIIKRIGAVLVALSMMLVMAIPALAVGETGSTPAPLKTTTQGTIKVTDAAATDSFNAYKVLDITYDADQNTANYALSPAFDAFLKSASNGTAVKDLAAYQATESDSDTMKNLMGGFAAYCVKNNVAAAYTWTGDAETTVGLGQYVLTGSSTGNEAVVYGPMTASFEAKVGDSGEYEVNTKVEIVSKKTQPTIDKEITGKVNREKDVQYSMGDTVEYQIVTTIPDYPVDAIQKTYKIGDTLTKGLTGHNDLKVYGTAGGQDTLLAETTNYDIEKNDGTELVLAFKYDTIKSYESIKVTYGSVVTPDAVLGTEGNPNTAYLEYSNTPYTQKDSTSKPEDEEKVYTYEIRVTKVDDGTGEGLQGVEFKLYKDEDCTELVKFSKTDKENVYKCGGDVETLVTGEKGVLELVGLDVGTYYLKETKAAAGYSVPAKPFVITVTDADKDGNVDDEKADDAIVDFLAENSKTTTTLPHTGGVGTYVFIGIGAAGMIAAGIAYIVIRKKGGKESKTVK